MEVPAPEKGSESVRAVTRALELLLAFTRDDVELTASELLQRVHLSRPTLYRLLYTLEANGFIESIGDPQRFRLGPAVSRLAAASSEVLDITTVAEPIMRKLWLDTRETVAVFVAQGMLRRCLAEMPSPQPLNFKRGVGYTERIVLGASGRAILAFMPGVANDLERYAHGLDIDPARLRRELASTRQRGYALSRSELIEGAVGVAAPFFDRHGVAGSIGIFGPATRLDDKKTAALGKLVAHEAQSLSASLGAVPGPAPTDAKPRR